MVGRARGAASGPCRVVGAGSRTGGRISGFTGRCLGCSFAPTVRPSDRPTVRPSDRPTVRPSDRPTVRPPVRPCECLPTCPPTVMFPFMPFTRAPHRTAAARALAAALVPGQRVCLTTHVSPDGDGLGSEAGLAHLLRDRGIEAVITNPTPTPPRFAFLL